MKKFFLLLSFVLLTGNISFAADEDMMNEFYGSMTNGCIISLDNSTAVANYCKCATDVFKKNFSKSDMDGFIAFTNSISAKPLQEQVMLISEFVSTPEYQKKMMDAAMQCIHFLTDGKK